MAAVWQAAPAVAGPQAYGHANWLAEIRDNPDAMDIHREASLYERDTKHPNYLKGGGGMVFDTSALADAISNGDHAGEAALQRALHQDANEAYESHVAASIAKNSAGEPDMAVHKEKTKNRPDARYFTSGKSIGDGLTDGRSKTNNNAAQTSRCKVCFDYGHRALFCPKPCGDCARLGCTVVGQVCPLITTAPPRLGLVTGLQARKAMDAGRAPRHQIPTTPSLAESKHHPGCRYVLLCNARDFGRSTLVHLTLTLTPIYGHRKPRA